VEVEIEVEMEIEKRDRDREKNNIIGFAYPLSTKIEYFGSPRVYICNLYLIINCENFCTLFSFRHRFLSAM
jgi:hypothetical protein